MDFIANDGSYAHRGVWHITDNLTQTDYPATHEVKDIQHNYPTPHVVNVQYVKPAHTIFRGDAICGQKDGMMEGGLDWGRHREIDKEHTVITYRVVKANVILDINSVPEIYRPGPLCIRCERKAGLV